MERLAIVGTGIAGLGCAHFLQDRYALTLFDQNDYIGGHTNTVDASEEGRLVPVDTGFMVFNRVTYPNLIRLFAELDVAVQPTTMSFSVQHCETGLEWNGAGLNRLFGQRRNLLRPRFWKLILQMDRFNKEAVPALEDPAWATMSLGEYVKRRGYGEDFLKFYLLPMGAAVWSTPTAQMLEFPAVTLLRFWHNHGFLGLDTHFQWWTVTGGSRSYVKKIKVPFADRIRLNCGVAGILRDSDGVTLVLRDGSQERFDRVIIAAHADQALQMLERPSDEESRLLGAFKYQQNIATLHSDPSFMPKSKLCWASWNYRVEKDAEQSSAATVHYWMNSLQNVSPNRNYFVSLNVNEKVDPSLVHQNIQYEHPVFSVGAMEAQAKLPQLNQLSGGQRTFYCGSYFKYGFHEDAFTSALDLSRIITEGAVWK